MSSEHYSDWVEDNEMQLARRWVEDNPEVAEAFVETRTEEFIDWLYSSKDHRGAFEAYLGKMYENACLGAEDRLYE